MSKTYRKVPKTVIRGKLIPKLFRKVGKADLVCLVKNLEALEEEGFYPRPRDKALVKRYKRAGDDLKISPCYNTKKEWNKGFTP